MKKLFVILLAVSLLCAYAVPANAAETTGKCGDNLTWTLVDQTLTISGTGAMYDYSDTNPAPWKSLNPNLRWIYIEQGVTSIGVKAFNFDVTSFQVFVTIPSSVTYIGDDAFHISRSGQYLFTFYMLGAAPEVGVRPFSRIEKIYVVKWSAADKKRMSVSESLFIDCCIQLNEAKSNRLVGLNEPLKAEDLAFEMYHESKMLRDYIPRQLTFGSYDNSTYGEKTVSVTADGFTSQLRYYVTDGTSHLDMIHVEFADFPEYTGSNRNLSPKVTMNSRELVKDTDYTLEFAPTAIGNGSRVTVKGKGIAQGFEKTFYYPIVKNDLSDQELYASSTARFNGLPTESSFRLSGDYVTFYENNINPGTATIRVVGTENYYGETRGNYEITLKENHVDLYGECIGKVGGNLSEDIPYYERILGPAKSTFYVDSRSLLYHVAAYALYKVDGEKLTLVKEYTSPVSDNQYSTRFFYDFTHVYEGAVKEGGELYLLSYSWVTENNDIYGGNMLLIVPSRVTQATSMTLHHVENDGDFRKDYLHLTGDDGIVETPTWTSSDSSVATVKNGTVTFKKPGTVVIKGKSGNLVKAHRLTMPQLYLSEGYIFDYSEAKGARVIYDNRVLTQGTDYVLSVKKEGNSVTLTAKGIGLFAGELVKTFDGPDSLADPHTHSFDNSCDGTCNGCDFTRSNDHSFTDKTTWSKNPTHHYYACTACGHPEELFEHSFLGDDHTVCAICGDLYPIGDVNGDCKIDSLDGLTLLKYLNGWAVELYSPDTTDLNQDGKIDSLDGLILMRYLNGWDIALG